MTPTAVPPTAGRWESATVLVVGLSVAFHLAALGENSLPSDLGQYYVALPELYAGITGQGPLGPALSHVIQRPGAWWNMLMAGWLWALGRSPANWQLLDLLVFTALLILGGNMGARVSGGRGRLAATVVLACSPMVVLAARSSWIHMPEAVLLLALVNTWLGDPRLSRLRTVGILGVLGVLALGLRPSAMPWLAVLGVAMSVGVKEARPPWTRLLMVAGIWALGLLQMLPYLSEYLSAKAASRDRYALRVPELAGQLLSTLGIPALVMGVIAAISSLRKPDGPRLQAWAWVLGPLVLVAVSKAGLDNFLPLVLGLAWLSADLMRRSGLWAIPWGLIYVLFSLPSLLSDRSKENSINRTLLRIGVPIRLNSGAGSKVSSQELLALIAATCPDPGRRCDILVDQGLLSPFGESAGELPIFLASHTPVRLIEMRSPSWPEQAQPAALVHWGCQGIEEQLWRERWPQSLYKVQNVSMEFNFRVAWEREVGECMMIWLTPGGVVPMPDMMPKPGAVPPDRRVRLRLNLPAQEPAAPPERPRPRVPGQRR